MLILDNLNDFSLFCSLFRVICMCISDISYNSNLFSCFFFLKVIRKSIKNIVLLQYFQSS